MLREEILTATSEWLNLKTLEALGIELVDTESDEGKIRIGEAILAKEHLAYKNTDKELYITNGGIWNPVEDIRDAYQLEEKIKEMGFQAKYADILYDEELGYPIRKNWHESMFDRLHATPQQRCKAFLLAMMEPGN